MIRSTPIAGLLWVVSVASALAEPSPAHDFVLHCAGCHRLDGSGSATVPALDALGDVLALPGGRTYLARVPGVAHAPLSDARIAALLDWVVAELNPGVRLPRLTPAEIARLRKAPLLDPRAARSALGAPSHASR